MNHLVLYRKYRPQKFSEVVGQQHVVKTLMNEIISGDISHAYLFTGPRGTGKTTVARLLAKSLNCQNRKPNEAEPCGKCSSCLEISQGRAVDLIEIDAGTNTGIDDIRNLKEGIGFSPVKSKYKVFIIDECHQLSKAAANALLKTLEEPPSHAIFILATTEPHKMIPTIVSRCQRFDFKRLSQEEIIIRLKTILKKENINFEEDALKIIAQTSNGSIRDAETLLDQAIGFSGRDNILSKETVNELLGLPDKTAVIEFLNFLQKKQPKEAIKIIHQISEKGGDLMEFLKTTLQASREMLLMKISPSFKGDFFKNLDEKNQILFNSIKEKVSIDFLKKILNIFLDTQTRLKYASIMELPLELAIIDICSI